MLGAYMLTASYVLANTTVSVNPCGILTAVNPGKIAQATADAGETLLKRRPPA
ncbi:MAG: hypothetical protein R2857_01590 [Vampirovibrionales bacterium]